MSLIQLKKELRVLGTLEKAKASARFFKTGKGQYGEGDIFIGITVPEQRMVAKKYADLALSDVEYLLHSREHEFRLTALLILAGQFERRDTKQQERIYNLYLRNTKYINNWDLVDSSAPHIVGSYLYHRKSAKRKSQLKYLAQSRLLWERRIAIVATYYFIKQGDVTPTLEIAEVLVDDEHDLIHKAVGWMLREVGKRSLKDEEEFLKRHAVTMPRTMLRYAIEKFPPKKRVSYLDVQRPNMIR